MNKLRAKITMSYTKDGVYSIALNKFIYKHKVKLILWLVISFVWVIGFGTLVDIGYVTGLLAVSPLIVGSIWFMYKYFKNGRKLWNEVKNKVESTDLGDFN